MISSSVPVSKEAKPSIIFLSLGIIAAFKFLLHLIVNATTAYGYFRDEFYYLACSDHLAWGYVDQPPFSVAMLKLSSLLFGESLWAVRVFPALAGAGVIFLTGLIVMKLGGKLFEVILAAIAVFVAPIFLAMNGFYSMNSFDHLFWICAVYLVMLIFDKPSLRLWVVLGIVLGLGLMNKISVLWLGAGIFVALMLTPKRLFLLTKGPYIAAGIAFLVFLPYLIWQQVYDWPLLEFIENASSQKYTEKSAFDFTLEATMMMHPVNALIWMAGLAYFLFNQNGKKHRWIGIIFLVIFLILISNKTSKAEYLAPAFPMLLAGGAVLIGSWLKNKWVRVSIVVLLIVGGILTAPLVVPLLPVEDYIAYAKAIGLEPSTSEKKELGPLPQFYADMHGWENMAIEISKIYENLPDADKGNAKFFGQNYGEAGAIAFYRNKYPLPPAVSGHNNYWIWGPGKANKDVVVIILGSNLEDNSKIFEEVEQKGIVVSKYAMPYESNLPVFVARNPKVFLEEIWCELKHYD